MCFVNIKLIQQFGNIICIALYNRYDNSCKLHQTSCCCWIRLYLRVLMYSSEEKLEISFEEGDFFQNLEKEMINNDLMNKSENGFNVE